MDVLGEASMLVADEEGHIIEASSGMKPWMVAHPGGPTIQETFPMPLAEHMAEAVHLALSQQRPIQRDIEGLTLYAFPMASTPPRILIHLFPVRSTYRDERLDSHAMLISMGLLSLGLLHELANPVAALASELEITSGIDDVEGLKISLTRIKKIEERLARSIRQMHDIAARPSQKAPSWSCPRHLLALVRRLAGHTLLASHRPRIVTEIDDGLPLLHAPQNRLVMVLLNLVANALEAMPEKGELRLEARCRQGGVLIAVEDTGTGMTPEELERALAGGHSRKHHGAGLGLLISRHIIASLGGKLALESTPGKGTRAHILFPPHRCGTWNEADLP